MKKRHLIFLGLSSLPFLLVILVNELPIVPDRTSKYLEEHCTWYCHDVTCKHWKDEYAARPTNTKKLHKNIFDWYVNSLHGNSLGLNYGAINILVFIIGYPFVGLLLLWNLVKDIT